MAHRNDHLVVGVRHLGVAHLLALVVELRILDEPNPDAVQSLVRDHHVVGRLVVVGVVQLGYRMDCFLGVVHLVEVDVVRLVYQMDCFLDVAQLVEAASPMDVARCPAELLAELLVELLARSLELELPEASLQRLLVFQQLAHSSLARPS